MLPRHLNPSPLLSQLPKHPASIESEMHKHPQKKPSKTMVLKKKSMLLMIMELMAPCMVIPELERFNIN